MPFVKANSAAQLESKKSEEVVNELAIEVNETQVLRVEPSEVINLS